MTDKLTADTIRNYIVAATDVANDYFPYDEVDNGMIEVWAADLLVMAKVYEVADRERRCKKCNRIVVTNDQSFEWFSLCEECWK